MTEFLNAVPQVRPNPSQPAANPVSRFQPADGDGLTFSKHLSERIERRQLEMSPDRMSRLADAVDRVASKGARDSVVLLDDLALLVNVPSRTVLTAIATSRMKDGVFTNIDSVVLG
ncbi:MAG: flagellar biosynthesis protein [candidate division Zixibacteria bacterium]|nr:flagellar biosynthesis protein [candidate division Zixibacteria bacterium]